MTSLIRFPSLDQYRNAIQAVQRRARYVGRDENDDPIYNLTGELPTLQYRGTVKLHGTNASIVWHALENEVTYQSRERILSLTQDNAGFMLTMMQHEHMIVNSIMMDILQLYVEQIPEDIRNNNRPFGKIAIFGEWCGGGIQKGVAINTLPKMFVVFAAKVADIWIDIRDLDLTNYNEHNIYNINQFPTFDIEIDFNHPELAQNKMIEITEAVEAECPVAKQLLRQKFNGFNSVGEGVVWTCQTPEWRSYDYAFKVKGEKHSVSKVKTLAAVDVEAVQALRDFVDNSVTEARLEWALNNMINEKLLPFEMKSMGDFIRIVYNDIIKEETDTIVASQLNPKKLGGPIANKARPWFMQRLNSKFKGVLK